ncbi:MAG: saccharopine dehydrogenase [Candidatus Aminicenantes bacterium]|nr:saccharopine dehydrogenase [Candidatus Aminicenantes bacterium]
MNKSVLVLGAGSVAPPLIKYLCKQPGIQLKIADQIFEKAQQLALPSPSAHPLHLDIRDQSKTRSLVKEADLVISILPYTFHPEIASYCVEMRTNMITASYVSQSMKDFDSEAKQKGILILNEIGLDPGIDHMEAMRIIHEIKNNNGIVTSFISFCGGLPAPEANTNPFGYKFSWSPRGVLLAGKNPAQYLENDQILYIPPEKLFQNPAAVFIKEVGSLEGYPNRDSLPYKELYQIPSARTLIRGTLRYKGWCSFMHYAAKIGLLEERSENWEGMTNPDFIRKTAGIAEQGDLKSDLANHLKIATNSNFIRCLDWLGIFKPQTLPLKQGSALDILVKLMEKRLSFQKGERDLILLQHKIKAEYKDKESQEITSNLIHYGNPDGDTAMSKTVGLPLAIAAKLILSHTIVSTGVQIPISCEIYEPILTELKESGIEFQTNISKIRERRGT